MYKINLYNIPNQEFEIEFDNLRYKIKLRTIQENFTIADIYINNELVKSSVRCCPNVPLIPYKYLRGNGGNFFFQCLDENYPNYTLFNKTQNLIYISNAELGA
jgi:hypothetical protein